MNLKLSLTASSILGDIKQVHPQSKQQFFTIKKLTKRSKTSKIHSTQETQNILNSQTSINETPYQIIKRLENLDIKQLHHSLAETQDPDVLLQFKTKQPKKKKLPSKIFSTHSNYKTQTALNVSRKSVEKNFKKMDNLKNSITIQRQKQKTQNIKQVSNNENSIERNKQNTQQKNGKQKFKAFEPKKIVGKTLTSLFSNKLPLFQEREEPDLCIDDFLVIKQIGEGTYSKVYQAVHKKTGFLCALKVLEKALMKQLKVQQNSIREIKILSCLSNHPNIITLYGSFTDNQKIYLILQYCTEGDVHQKFKKIRAKGKQTNQANQIKNITSLQNKQKTEHKQMLETVSILRQICLAIKQLHQNSIMHRDVKPQNILATMGNNIKLSDFGWSVHNPKDNLRKTLCGTPLYLAPEFITTCKYNDAIDIWSLGIMAYELFTHEFPFKIESVNDLIKIAIQQINFSKIKCPIARNFCQIALVKDRNQRAEIWDLFQHEIFRKYAESD